MNKLFTTLLILSLIGLSSAVIDDCAGYYDEFDVRVLDAKLRPIEGAGVMITFDRGASFGEKYFTTDLLETDENGLVHMAIHNQGTDTRIIDCTIWLNATISDGYTEKTVEANAHGPVVDLVLDVYPIGITVNDQSGNPIENATITINGVSRDTGPSGKAKFHASEGEVSYFVSYLKGKEGGMILVTDDIDYEVVLLRYSISIDAVDDQGVPVEATITIFDETIPMEGGHYEADDIYGSVVDATVSYMSLDKNIELVLSEQTETIIVFDTHAPVIESITTSSVGKRPRITLKVTDEGEYASGVDPVSVKVTYRVLPSADTQWSDASTFVSGVNTYVSDFPEIEPGKLIEFKIEVQDLAGNKIIQSGKFLTEKEEEPVEPPTEDEEETQDFPFFYIAIGVILIIVVVYIVRYLIKRKGNEV